MVHSVSFYNFRQISSDTGPNFEELAAANGMDSFHIELISRRLKELRGETHEAITCLVLWYYLAKTAIFQKNSPKKLEKYVNLRISIPFFCYIFAA